MRGLKKTRRIQVLILAAVALALATGIIGYAMRDGISFFRSPAQVLAEPPSPNEVFRLGGLVEEGTLSRGQGETVTFSVTDGAASVPVAYTGILPDLFEEGQGMVGQGRWTGEHFEAIEILAKHDESYMPKEVIDALEEQGVYKAPNAASPSN
ncbi:cytochrome c-type biogenesis protein CcmE [Limimaricola soesokkakensis]|uniref:Cytochrome c-type biogenesis protein CcmE n=1 Tax=Limimaricola soesokkakensis TaxID=1343159 RepID=A0A1X6YXZ0_9RHOB|nr:cytochrome c maturation protein CcmE [Limimaricola soesokkakensis]PSK87832.1 cytochrome c-type biogenesis protein CcmE [Limimaricola soesokkakensis]SLN34943.1 Cytochrome c-type biogenesis protein CcmE [Limimaricola soesokkakensis]